MAVTRLKRKGRRNIVVAKGKVASIQRLNAVPVIKQVDIEQLKEEYKAKAATTKSAPKKEEKVEAPKAAETKEAPKKKAAAPKAEKETAKKPAAKKAAPKKEAKED